MENRTENGWLPLISSEVLVKVSSTLDRSVGKKHLIDRNPETGWTSAEGLPQFVHLIFPKAVIAKKLLLTFQGGFVGTRCRVQLKINEGQAGDLEGGWIAATTVFPEDVNRRQSFLIPGDQQVTELKLVFDESSDFFGRITLYDVQLDGCQVTAT